MQSVTKHLGRPRGSYAQYIGNLVRPLDFYGVNRDFLDERRKERMLAGPAETGKTFTTLQICLEYAWEYPGCRGVIARKVGSSMHSTVLRTWEDKILPHRWKAGSFVSVYGGSQPKWYDFSNGSRIYISGMDNADGQLSGEFDFIYFNQAEQATLDDWEKLLTRVTGRAGNMPFNVLFGDCNPGADNHWIQKRKTLAVYSSRHQDNPTLYDQSTGELTAQGEITMETLSSLTGIRRKRLFLGLWVRAEGVVYEEFITKHHVRSRAWYEELRKSYEVTKYIAAMDWGYNDAGVFQLFAIIAERMILVLEIYKSRQLQEWWQDQVKSVYDSPEYRTDDDSAESRSMIEAIPCDPSRPEYIQAMAKKGLPAEKAYNSIPHGIQGVQQRLKDIEDDLGIPGLIFLEDASMYHDEVLRAKKLPLSVMEEMGGYVWKTSKDGREKDETPVDRDNHGLDTTRYAVAHHDNLGEAESKEGYSWVEGEYEITQEDLDGFDDAAYR